MTDTRKWSAAAVVLIAAIFAAGWFLLVSPKRSEAADLKAQTVSQESANAVARAEAPGSSRRSRPTCPQQRARLAAITTQIPDNPALPSLIRDLTARPQGRGRPSTRMAPVRPPLGASRRRRHRGAVGRRAPAAGATARRRASGRRCYQVPLTLNVTGSYFELEQFLNKLEGLQAVVPGHRASPSAPSTAPTAAPDGDLTIDPHRPGVPQPQPATTPPPSRPSRLRRRE